MAPSTTQGAVSPSHLSAAMKVWVPQRPNGAEARKRCPRRLLPIPSSRRRYSHDSLVQSSLRSRFAQQSRKRHHVLPPELFCLPEPTTKLRKKVENSSQKFS